MSMDMERKPRNVAELLLKTAKVFEDNPEVWCQEGLAFTADGDPCDPDSSDAAQWCLMGMMDSLASDDTMVVEAQNVLEDALKEDGTAWAIEGEGEWGISVAVWNDRGDRNVSDVVKLLRKAVVMA